MTDPQKINKILKKKLNFDFAAITQKVKNAYPKDIFPIYINNKLD